MKARYLLFSVVLLTVLLSVAPAAQGTSIGEAKALANGTHVLLAGKALYLKQVGFGYIEEPDRTAGICVEGTLAGSVGDLVCVGGVIRTRPGGERYVLVDTMASCGTGSVDPLTLSNRSLLDGIVCGLYVKVWGKVMPGSIMPNSYWLTDGSHAAGIRVITPGDPGVTENAFVNVVGAAGLDGVRCVRTSAGAPMHSTAATATIEIYPGANWITPPLVPLDPNPVSVFGGRLDRIDGKLHRYDAASGTEVTYDSGDPGSFGGMLLGDGYVLESSEYYTVTYDGVPDGAPGPGGEMTDMWISLPGSHDGGQSAGGEHWIGSGFDHNLQFADCYVTDGTSLKTLDEAVEAGWIDGLWSAMEASSQIEYYGGRYDGYPYSCLERRQMYKVDTLAPDLALIVLAYSQGGDPPRPPISKNAAVSGVTATQRTGCKSPVDIVYTLGPPAGYWGFASAQLSDDGGMTYKPQARTLSGGLGPVPPGTNCIVWDDSHDLPTSYSNTYRARVSAGADRAESGIFAVDTCGIGLYLSPDLIEMPPWQTVTAEAYAPAQSSVVLTFDGLGFAVPPVAMTPWINHWQATFGTTFLAFCTKQNVTVHAIADLGLPTHRDGVATLWLGSKPVAPPCPVPGLQVGSDNTDSYNLAYGVFDILSCGSIPLSAKLVVNQDQGLWFAVDVLTSGSATWSPCGGNSLPELLGEFPLGPIVNPKGSVALTGTFSATGDKVTVRLNLLSVRAAVANVGMILLAAVPEGTPAPQDYITIIQDLQALRAVRDAGMALFDANTSKWLRAVNAFWALRTLLTDKQQREALAWAFAKLGKSVSESKIKDIVTALSVFDLLKIIYSEGKNLWITKGDTIDCSYEAYFASTAGELATAANPAVALASTSRSADAEATVTWEASPSVTDWLTRYIVTNSGAQPIWALTVFYEPSVGAPLAVSAPLGWTPIVDSVAGTVIWYTEGPSGWTNNDFGAAAIQPGGSLTGFAIRHVAAPGCSGCCCTDAAYGTSAGLVAAPGPPQGVTDTKVLTEGSQVVLSDRVVTAAFDDGTFYVQDPQRTCGIRVRCPCAVSVGQTIRLAGVLGVENGEAVISSDSCLAVGHGIASALGVRPGDIGGRDFALQHGVAAASGLNNIGLLVRTWGHVTGIDPAPTPTWFKISDGSGVEVKCVVPSTVTIDVGWHYVAVTGVSSCYKTGDDLYRLLRVREQGDISVLQ